MIRVVMLAFIKGTSPIMAVEIGRRAIPGHARPSFAEVEKACREKAEEAAVARSRIRKTMADEQPIIIKKKGGHGGHHGGAWKVAYADFVTAMMALFIVLWMMNTSKPVQHAVSGYFRDPRGTAEKKGTGLGGEGQTSHSHRQKARLGEVKGRPDEGHGKPAELRQAQKPN